MAITISGMQPNAGGQEQRPDSVKPQLDKDATVDDIYGAIFGAQPSQAISLPYPVIIAGLNQGDVVMTPSNIPGETRVDRKAVVDLLLPFLVEDKQAELLELDTQEETITTARLNSIGLIAAFDHTNLLLQIDIPLQIRSVVPVALRPRINPTLGLTAEEQASTSAILNVAAGTRYVHASDFIDTGFSTTQINANAALNVRNVVFETGVRYSDTADQATALNDTRVTKDLVDRQVRLQAGDLDVPTSGLQGRPRLLGLAGFRNFNLQPYEEYRTNPSQQFELQRSARVLVYINGQFVREFRLNPGRYSLTDLPLQSAAGNDVTLEIEYDNGEIDTVIFSAFYDFSLLKDGVTDFAVAVGPTSDISDGAREYDLDNPAISAFYRRGWTDEFTAGVNAQADTNLINVGVDAFYATGIGTFGFLGGFSDNDEGSGAAATALYRWNNTNLREQTRINLQARYQGEDYATLGGSAGNIEYDLAARASRDFSADKRIQLSTGFRKRHQFSDWEQSHSANLTWRNNLGTLGTSLRYTTGPNQDEEWSLGISFNMRLGNGYAQISHDTRSPSTRATYTSRLDRSVGSLGWDATYSRQSGLDEVRLGGSYIGNRYEARAEQRFTAANPNESFGSEIFTDLFVASALVYADGTFALSRPVYDSFVIFSKNDAVKDYEIAADPQGSVLDTKRGYMAHSSRLGPAVVPDLNGYYIRTIEVEAPDAPPGTSLGGQALNFLPSYRAGYVVEVGDDRNVSVMSTLVDQNGEPVAFAAGYAITSDGERRQMFTNRGGRFYIDGLKHGEKIRIEFDSPPNTVAQFTVPEGDIGLTRLGTPVQLFPAEPTTSNEVATNHKNMEVNHGTL